MDELKQCPFCGSKDLRKVQMYESNDEHYIACNDCNSQGGNGLTLLHAIRYWNNRVQLQKSDRERYLDYCKKHDGDCKISGKLCKYSKYENCFKSFLQDNF